MPWQHEDICGFPPRQDTAAVIDPPSRLARSPHDPPLPGRRGNSGRRDPGGPAAGASTGRTTAQPVISPLEWLVDPPQPHSVGQTIQIHHYGAAQGNNDSNQISTHSGGDARVMDVEARLLTVTVKQGGTAPPCRLCVPIAGPFSTSPEVPMTQICAARSGSVLLRSVHAAGDPGGYVPDSLPQRLGDWRGGAVALIPAHTPSR